MDMDNLGKGRKREGAGGWGRRRKSKVESWQNFILKSIAKKIVQSKVWQQDLFCRGKWRIVE